jgi:hypothetical protein
VHYYIYSGANVTAGHIMAQGAFVLEASPGEGGGAGDIPIWDIVTGVGTAQAIDVGQTVGIAIVNTTGVDGGLAVHSWELIDAVNLNAVPEPTTAALLGFAGLSGLLALRRRRA